jgi:hypothetical protein
LPNRLLAAGLFDELLKGFDVFISVFVIGQFQMLKIFNFQDW